MSFKTLQGDWIEVLRTLPDESVHMVCTSPPYWNLRDYGTATWEGGDAECEHIDPAGPINAPSAKSTLTTNNGQGPLPGDKYQSDRKTQFRDTCGKCGAIRIDRQLGLERTPELYVAKMVEGFREVRRVLRSDGVCWINLGDSYAASWPCQRRNKIGSGSLENGKREARPPRFGDGLKNKDLVGIPWMVAFALRADGWWLRSEIIWAKKNSMPESVTDRPTKAHEQIFLLTKSAQYFYDAEAIKEWSAGTAHDRGNGVNPKAIIAGGAEGEAGYCERCGVGLTQGESVK